MRSVIKPQDIGLMPCIRKRWLLLKGSQEGWHRGIASCPFTDRRLFVCLKLTGEEENERKNNQTLAHWGHEYFVTARHFEFNRQ